MNLYIHFLLTISLFISPYTLAHIPVPFFSHTPVYNHIDHPIDQNVDVLVAGGGLTGSSAAFYLNKKGLDVLVTEERSDVGGCLVSNSGSGFQWEEGANSFQPSISILRFARDIGLLNDLVLANPSLPRYVYWDGTLHAVPMSFSALFKSKLLSWRAKLRAVLGAIGFVSRRPTKEESIREFAIRHFGEEVYTRLVDPFISGVYAGDPTQLSMKAALNKLYALEDQGLTRGVLEGAVVQMLRRRLSKEKVATKRDGDELLPNVPAGSLGSFRGGLQDIPRQIHRILGEKVCTATSLERLDRVGDRWICTLRSGGRYKQVGARSVLLTLPAYTTAALLAGEGGPLAAANILNNISYPPVAAVVTSYPDSAFNVKPVGFGHLLPRAAGIRTLGTIWASTLFPNRAPPGEHVMVSFIGGAQDSSIANLSTDELIAQVDSDLRRVVLNPNAPPPRVLGVRIWSKAIPQYNKNHLNICEELDRALQTTPGLFVGGNFKNGVSVGDCIQFGSTVSSKIYEYLSSSCPPQ
mmetsp:Transcript_24874/g.36690  ORF Transcript_24874/g.36690 Transcript_24874/m.36690 type:complete len:523 (-) Transcript_24874:279-1847(-)